MDIQQTLAIATEHHRAGRTAEADRLYREILDGHPGQPDALHLLGVLALQAGRPTEAAGLIGRAIAGDGGSPLFHANLGHAQHASGCRREAALSFARALALLSNQGEGWGGIATLCNLVRRYDEATRRAAAAEVEARSTMADVLRRRSLLFFLSGDIAHYEALTRTILEDPSRFSLPSIHYAYWGMAMQMFQGAARSGDAGGFGQGNFRRLYRLMVEETERRFGLGNRMTRKQPSGGVKRIALVTNQMLGAEHQPTADAFDYARRLQDEFGREVVIVNTNAMAIGGETGFLPDYSYNVTEEYEGAQTIAAFGARVRMLSFPQRRFDEEKLRLIVDAVEDFDPDVVVAFGGSNCVADLFAGRRPVVCVPTSSGPPPTLAPLVLGYAPEDDARSWPADLQGRFRPFSFGWTLPESRSAAGRTDFGLPAGGPVFVTVGNRLDQEVGDDFLAMADALLDRLPDARLAFAGGAESLPGRLAGLRNAGRAHALGHVADIRALYRLATAYLNPRRQGGGGSAAFALAEGLPVVTHAGGDVARVAGKAFIVAEDRSFAERAEMLATDAALRARQSEEAVARFASAGSRHHAVERLLAYCREAQTA